GEPGSEQEIGVFLPDRIVAKNMSVNGREVRFNQEGSYVWAHVKFEGQKFTHSEQIKLATGVGGSLNGTFVVPKRIFAQLSARKKKWPIAWTKEDYETTWLAPERLLLF